MCYIVYFDKIFISENLDIWNYGLIYLFSIKQKHLFNEKTATLSKYAFGNVVWAQLLRTLIKSNMESDIFFVVPDR